MRTINPLGKAISHLDREIIAQETSFDRHLRAEKLKDLKSGYVEMRGNKNKYSVIFMTHWDAMKFNKERRESFIEDHDMGADCELWEWKMIIPHPEKEAFLKRTPNMQKQLEWMEKIRRRIPKQLIPKK